MATSPPVDGRRPAWNEVLRALREARGATQEGWAARLGVSRKTVQRWESGERAPDPGAETAILGYCREAGLLHRFDRGPLSGLDLSEARLRELFAEARWHGDRVAAGAPASDRPAESGSAPSGALPAHLTSFVGRQREIAAVRRVQAGTRLLTLTGPGGCGKTRLALALANELLWAYPHGVWFVDLAPLADPSLTAQAVATALSVRASGAEPLTATLARVLHERRLLLLLDNCEQLLPGCAELVEQLLRAAPYLEIVATSREPLGVPGEVVWRVPPLAQPDGETAVDGDAAEERPAVDAVQLFVERARLQRPEFAVTAADARLIAAICRTLDGMPLAIELAAARVGVLPLAEIAARLHDRFALLSGNRRTLLPRQQTLRATMDWSYDLLTAEERALLRLLAVFRGGFALDAVEALAAAALEPSAVLDLLARLVDKSLVVVDERSATARFSLLETVRQYAELKLHEEGDLPATRDRHAAWCLDLAEAAAAELQGPRAVGWLARLEAEHDNLRAALQRGIDAADAAKVAALRLAGTLARFWELRGYLGEGRRWLEQTLAACPQAPADARALALRGLGALAYKQGDYGDAARCFSEACDLARATGDRAGLADALGKLGRTALRQGDHAAALGWLDAALTIATELDDAVGIASVQFSRGVLALRRGEYTAAEERFQTSLALNRKQGNKEGIANALEELATIRDEQGAGDDSTVLLEESLALYRELEDRAGVAAVLGHLGMEAWARGDADRAEELLAEGLALYDQVGDRRGVARLLGNRSLVVFGSGDLARAAALCRESLSLYIAAGDSWAVGRYLPVLASVDVRAGRLDRAVRLFAAAAALREQLGAALPPIVRTGHDRLVATVRERLGTSTFAALWAEGTSAASSLSAVRALCEMDAVRERSALSATPAVNGGALAEA